MVTEAVSPLRTSRLAEPTGSNHHNMLAIAETRQPVPPVPVRAGGREIQVERIRFLRYGEERGDYNQVVATLNASGPHEQ